MSSKKQSSILVILIVAIIALVGIAATIFVLQGQASSDSTTGSGDNPTGQGTKVSLVVSSSPIEGGKTTPSGKTLWNVGSVTTVKAIPNAGYLFSGWIIGNKPSDSKQAEISVTVSKDTQIMANFVKGSATTTTTTTTTTQPVPLKFSVVSKPSNQVFSQGSMIIAKMQINRIEGMGEIKSSVSASNPNILVSIGPQIVKVDTSVSTMEFQIIISGTNNLDTGTYSVTATIASTLQTETATFNVQVTQSLGSANFFATVNGLPQTGVTVNLYNTAGFVVKTATTDNLGKATISGVPVGDYVAEMFYGNMKSSSSVNIITDRSAYVIAAWQASMPNTGALEVRIYLNNQPVTGDVSVINDKGYDIAPGRQPYTAEIPIGTYTAKVTVNWYGQVLSQSKPITIEAGKRTFYDAYLINTPLEFQGLSIEGATGTLSLYAIVGIFVVVIAIIAIQPSIIGMKKRV